MYQTHQQAVHSIAARLAGDTRAADVTQEVFVRLWRDPQRFDPTRGSLRTFLVSVARNVAVDLLRADGSRSAREHRVQEDASTTAASTEVSDSTILGEDRDRMIAALGRISAVNRQAIVTAFYGQLTYAEAASALGQPEGTIKARIRSGLLQLRTELGRLQV